MPAPNILIITTDLEIVVEEEITPGLIQQDSFGLESILDDRTFFAIPGQDFDRFTEKIQAHQGRLAPLPGEGDLWRWLDRQVLARVLLQQVIAPTKICSWIQFLFFQLVAVLAGQVAYRTAKFHHNMKAAREMLRSRWPYHIPEKPITLRRLRTTISM